ncbi:IS200/IS605 family transposase [Natrinema sp. LN54]|uniref:IS200/IS605 family transposase n=1 Tax=Natrinema sp. LN54 TaxID=3458705 RepID=UPI0040367FFB
MEYHLQSGPHTVYALQYHFVTVTKYRADILTDERLERVAEVAHEIADGFEADIKSVDGGADHVHILFTTKPTTELTKFINSLKGVTSRRIRKEYPEVKDHLEDAFWQPGYFLATTGQVIIDVLMNYVADQ